MTSRRGRRQRQKRHKLRTRIRKRQRYWCTILGIPEPASAEDANLIVRALRLLGCGVPER